MTGGSYIDKAMEAIKETGDNNGASLQAIKKYLEINYENDFKNDTAQNTHLKKALHKAIESNVLYHPGRKTGGKFKISPQSTPSKKKISKKKTSKRSPAKKSPRSAD